MLDEEGHAVVQFLQIVLQIRDCHLGHDRFRRKKKKRKGYLAHCYCNFFKL